MSKIGKQAILLPENVTVESGNVTIIVKGPKGSLEKTISKAVDFEVKDNILRFSIKKITKQNLSDWGTMRSILANAVNGVTNGWEKKLELVGTGYRAEVRGQKLILNVGFSHPVEIEAPEGVSFGTEKNVITVSGIDKEVVGQIASEIRSKRPPEPYKGKGVKYVGEIIRRKAGKAAKASGA